MSRTKKKEIDFLEGPLTKSILLFTLPVMATGVLQFLYNASDSAVVGWLIGRDALGAVSSTGSLSNLITGLFIGLSVGATANGEAFIQVQTIAIVVLGLAAFSFSTIGGVLLGKLLCVITHGKINPLIGSAGVSAVPMAARVAQKVGSESDPHNFLLMHAMGPNVAGVIGSAIAAGVLMALFG